MKYSPTVHTKAFAAPTRYYQGAGVTRNVLPAVIAAFGTTPLLMGSPRALAAILRHGLASALDAKALNGTTAEFGLAQPWGRECCPEEINRLIDLAQDARCDVIVGIGGGKAVDTAKAVSYRLRLPVIIVPTVASTDAPTAAVAVIYSRDHHFHGYEFHARSPDAVVVDTLIIAEAPPRLLACGIGDAYSKRFEVSACYTAGHSNQIVKPFGGVAPLVSLHMATLLHTLLTTYGVQAMTDVRNKKVSPALEAVVEGCILISGLAFESGGLSAAHSLYNAFTVLKSQMSPQQYRGELVHFGTCIELFLEEHPPQILRDAFTFGHQVGLPETLKEIGLSVISEEALWKVAEKATAAGETIHKAQRDITTDDVFLAIKAADEYGRTLSHAVPRVEYT